MAHQHSPGFLALVEHAKQHVREMSIEELQRRRAAGENIVLVDVREDDEWRKSHLPDAVHLSKGIIERDIERQIPDKQAAIVCQCGGGFRSALVCESLERMGYTNTWSLAEGFRGWVKRGLPLETT
jgi:rhodanese-related sulfurtransferase